MKKIVTIILIILLSLALIFIVYKIATYKEKPFNKIEFNKEHVIYNFTNNQYLDTIVESGLQLLKIDTVTIIIKNIEKTTENVSGEELDLKAYIKKGTNNIYYIFIGDYNKSESIIILSHELIHLKQYYDKKLIVSDVCVWENDTIDIFNITYEQRPWEKEAFLYQHSVSKSLNRVLYDKIIY